MGFFTKDTKNISAPIIQQEQRSLFSDAISYNSASSYISSQSMRLSAVYAATNIISNSVATLSLDVFNKDSNGFKNINVTHQLNYFLNIQPSNNLSKFNFFKLVISSIILKGNAYAIINRDSKGEITGIKYIQPELVTVNYNQIADKIIYYVNGYKQPIEAINMLHFWMHSNDLVNGISIINYAVNTLKGATDAENHASNFFKSGAASNGILKSTSSTISTIQKEQIKSAWNGAFSDPTSAGVAVLPLGLDYQSISVNAKDAQLLESRNFSVVEIARFFNISPVKLYDLSKSSYSTLESTQLQFLQDTINPYLVLIEQEFNRKLFSKNEQLTTTIEFNRSEMLSTDKQAIATYYKEMLVNGIMTINEVRKALNLNDIDGMNKLFIQLNMSTVDNIVNGTPAPEQVNLQQKTEQKQSADK